MLARRHHHLIIALLLPLMVLRAMLPAGYMPVVQGGELHIVMCSEGLAPGGPAAADSKGHKLPVGGGDCPFAHSTIDAPPVIVRVAPAFTPVAELPPSVRAQLPPNSQPPRQHSARGPPVFS